VPSNIETIGIIAGSKSLPLLFAKQARAMGLKKIVAVAFEGETDPALASLVDHISWVKVGQLTKMINALKQQSVRQCVMLGQINPKSLFDLRPDLRAMSLLLKLKQKNAHTIFGAVADDMKKEGIELIEPLPWLKPLMPLAGFALGPKLTNPQKEDVAFGFKLAKECSRLEIGQTVVVKAGTVLAVEGFEGTDACCQRGGELAGPSGGAIVVKVAKEKHDLRFDIPCLGPKTIETCRAAKISVLTFEPGKTLILETELFGELAKKHKISVVTADV
jgi:UDP-2,3-diacylglucosamine hydrolase